MTIPKSLKNSFDVKAALNREDGLNEAGFLVRRRQGSAVWHAPARWKRCGLSKAKKPRP